MQNEVLINNGIEINKSKTKVTVESIEKKEIQLILDEGLIKEVISFQYLWITLEKQGIG